ncbi:MAG: hypothetical protein LAT68_10365 [Cyclobacteriaceae bacterium]|nr:hypothetical protein [Cyclobacteriaceae bacterium]MCH8516718.1 hypothetical protein [Cyclobacteriaceae bacterium]
MNLVAKTTYFVIAFFFAISFLVILKEPELFNKNLGREDGLLEDGTFWVAFFTSVFLVFHTISQRSNMTITQLSFGIFYAFLFLFIAGEEISWGQRLFDIETSDALKQINAQDETNLHNLEINGVKINKLIFGKLLTIIAFTYMIIFPLLYKRWGFLQRLAIKCYVPIPKWHHAVAFVTVTVLTIMMGVSRQWEMYELAAISIFALVFVTDREYLKK